jgi:hypothetical protein
LDPGTITGLELPAVPELVRGVTSGRDPAEEPPLDELFNAPPLVPYMVGR